MSGIFTTKSLAAGYLNNTIQTLYQAPSGNTGYVKSIIITSNNANPQQITLYKNISGNLYPWTQFTLNGNEFADVLEMDSLALSANDSIQGSTNLISVSAVAYTIHGVEER